MDKIEMLQELIKKAERLAALESKVDSLHNMIDAEETRTMRRGYSRDIYTETVREVFGWPMCDAAKAAGLEYEAEKEAEKAAKEAE